MPCLVYHKREQTIFLLPVITHLLVVVSELLHALGYAKLAARQKLVAQRVADHQNLHQLEKLGVAVYQTLLSRKLYHTWELLYTAQGLVEEDQSKDHVQERTTRGNVGPEECENLLEVLM